MTTSVIPLAPGTPTLAPTLAIAPPGATDAFAALFDAEGEAADQPAAERQDDASSGKTLPGNREITDVVPQAMLAWLLAPVPIVAAANVTPAPVASPAGGAAPMIVVPAAPSSPALPAADTTLPSKTVPIATVPQPVAALSSTPVSPQVSGTTPTVSALLETPAIRPREADAETVPMIAASLPTLRTKPIGTAHVAAITLAAAAAPTLSSAAPAPAARVFAAALHQLAAPDDRAERDASAPPLAAFAGIDTTLVAVTAPTAAGDAQLNMADRRWPEAMIARISALRDASDALAATASIDKDHATVRLSPDALGTVEVRLHREDDQVRVQLTAEQPRTQALLADAQPRLTELAEARGIRVVHAGASQSGHDAGTPSQGRGQPSAAPSTIRNLTADESADAPSIGRIA